MRFTDEAGDTRGMPHGAPRGVGEIHPHEDVTGHPNAADELLLAVLDLGHLLHGDVDLEDVVLHVEADDAGLKVGLDPVLIARVGVHNEPLARLGAQGGLELGDRVDDLSGLFRRLCLLRRFCVVGVSRDVSVSLVDNQVGVSAVDLDHLNVIEVRLVRLDVEDFVLVGHGLDLLSLRRGAPEHPNETCPRQRERHRQLPAKTHRTRRCRTTSSPATMPMMATTKRMTTTV